MVLMEDKKFSGPEKHAFRSAGLDDVEVTLHQHPYEMKIPNLTRSEVFMIAEYLKTLGLK